MNKPYQLLPFRFDKKGDNYLLVNDVGEFYSLEKIIFNAFIDYKLDVNKKEFLDLKAKHFFVDDNLSDAINLLATRYRSKKRFLYDFTSLHMVVVTRRCNQDCRYCHASSLDENTSSAYDMNIETAEKAVEHIFNSPSQNIKIEFQGGEPLLNFEIVKAIYEIAVEANKAKRKNMDFVICTNLLSIDDQKIEFIKANNISISTSLDGPQDIHDSCRIKRNGSGSYSQFIKSLTKVKKEISHDNISALVTVTAFNINRLRDVVDEYLKLGFKSIFIRNINPFGAARNNWEQVGYSIGQWIESYKEVLEYIIQINLAGKHFPEVYASLLLTRILTPFSTGFVDLQSPSGAGISGAIYDINGDVYVSDEARMLAALTGDKKFCLGNIHKDDWNDIFCGKKLKEIVSKTCIESIPGCAWCAYQPFCGSDPVRNYCESGNLVGNRSMSEFCQKHKALFRLLFEYLSSGNEDIQDVFWSWITCRSIQEIRGKNFLQYPT
jgi:uncharacterized protein